MKRKYILIFLIVLVTMPVLSLDVNNETDPVAKKRSAFFVSYMKETFPDFKLTDGEYLFILPTGCFNCNRAACDYLLSHPESIRGKYKAILISQSTLERLSDKILLIDKNILCDKTNKLDKMSFGISGISVLKIQNLTIVASKSLTVSDVQQGTGAFFQKL